MSDSDFDREAAAKRLLLRSARLDAPPAALQARVLERALTKLGPSPRARQARQVSMVAAALALAAVAVLVLRKRSDISSQRVQAEAPKVTVPVSAPSASAAPPLQPCPKLLIARGDTPLIDDLEDRNARLAIADGREGTWMVYNDGSGKQTPPGLSPLHPERLQRAREQSRYALHTSGGNFSIWGSIIVATFTDGGCYDVSAYGGIEFWAKGNTRIHVQLSVIDEISKENGGLCAGSDCYSSPRKAFDLGPQWQKYRLTFAELARLNQAPRMRFDPERVVSLNLSIHREDTPFDIWIDDVRFLERQ